MYSINHDVRTNRESQLPMEAKSFSADKSVFFSEIKSNISQNLDSKICRNRDSFSLLQQQNSIMSNEFLSHSLGSRVGVDSLHVLSEDICHDMVKQSPETDPLSREFRRVSCSQSVRELIHEMAQIQDMLIMDSTDPWADIQRRTALLDPGFREVLQRHMARAAALLERIERDCGDVLSPEELAECARLKGAFERMRRYAGADLITAGGELVEASYQQLMGAMRDVAAGMRDVLGAVITGLGASAAFLMNLLRSQFAH
jgi:hypothetical protein